MPIPLSESHPAPQVVLLHGLGRTKLAMWPVARYLHRLGFEVTNLGYPSRRFAIADLARDPLASTLEKLPVTGPLMFVTHSLGGILLRYYGNYLADERTRERISRVVMLAPPNQGAELADQLADNWLFNHVLGPAFAELGTAGDALCQDLLQRESQHPLPWQVGVIAGYRSWEPWFSRSLPGSNDGKVTVERTQLPWQSDFIAMPVNHTTLMWHRNVLQQVGHFLQQGRFASLVRRPHNQEEPTHGR